MLREDRIVWLKRKIQELREDDDFIEGTHIASGYMPFLNDLHTPEEYDRYYDELEQLLEEAEAEYDKHCA